MIIQHPAHPNNYSVGRGGEKVAAVVQHIMQGTMGGTIATFQQPTRRASTHYGVGTDGQIVQFVDEHNTAWGNGALRESQPWIPWLQECVDKTINPNQRTISIEWEGAHTGGIWEETEYQGAILWTFRHETFTKLWVPTPPQYAAGLGLTRAICIRHNLPFNRIHIIRHSDIDSITRWFCPGLGFPMTRLLLDLTHPSAPPSR